jgi:hypothetical protein
MDKRIIISQIMHEIDRGGGSFEGVGSGLDTMVLQLLRSQELIDNIKTDRHRWMIIVYRGPFIMDKFQLTDYL